MDTSVPTCAAYVGTVSRMRTCARSILNTLGSLRTLPAKSLVAPTGGRHNSTIEKQEG